MRQAGKRPTGGARIRATALALCAMSCFAAAIPPPAAKASSLAKRPAATPLDAATVQLAPTPPMGWNPWYRFGCQIDEAIVEQTAAAMVANGMAAAGYRYVNLDDCWMAPDRDADGALQADPQTFPSGIAALAAFVHRLGLKLGIYLDSGTATCMGRPGSSATLNQDLATVASWGVDFVKVDYCATNFAPPQPLYTAVEQAIQATGRPIVLSICEDGFEAPWHWAPGIASLWRTTNDYTAYGAAQGRWWPSVLTIAGVNSQLAQYAQPGAWNDPDILLTGDGVLSPSQERAQFSLWSMMAAPLLVGGDVRSMSRSTAATVLNHDVIAVDQDPLGLQGSRIANYGPRQVWLRQLADGARAVLFLNAGTRPLTLTLAAARAGIPNRGVYTITDLWRHRTWKSGARILRTQVAPDDIVMWRVEAMPLRRSRPRALSAGRPTRSARSA